MAWAQSGGGGVVLDVAALEAILTRQFNIGLDVGRGRGEPLALVRLRLSKALLGAAEAQALAAESLAIERAVSTEAIAAAEGLALHAGAFNGIPDPVFHLTARAMGIVTGLALVEPDPRAPEHALATPNPPRSNRAPPAQGEGTHPQGSVRPGSRPWSRRGGRATPERRDCHRLANGSPW